jgi:hypothetical protein
MLDIAVDLRNPSFANMSAPVVPTSNTTTANETDPFSNTTSVPLNMSAWPNTPGEKRDWLTLKDFRNIKKMIEVDFEVRACGKCNDGRAIVSLAFRVTVSRAALKNALLPSLVADQGCHRPRPPDFAAQVAHDWRQEHFDPAVQL